MNRIGAVVSRGITHEASSKNEDGPVGQLARTLTSTEDAAKTAGRKRKTRYNMGKFFFLYSTRGDLTKIR